MGSPRAFSIIFVSSYPVILFASLVLADPMHTVLYTCNYLEFSNL